MSSRAAALALCCLFVLSGCVGGPVGDAGTAIADETASPATPDSATEIDAPPSATPEPDAMEVTVIEVVDGDTIGVRLQNGSEDTVRLLGVDTPEIHAENDPAEFPGVPEAEGGRNCLREWGERASEHAKEEPVGETVLLSFDDNEPRRGSTGGCSRTSTSTVTRSTTA